MAKCGYLIMPRDGGFCDEECAQPAVIWYDELNRCAEHADPNVLTMFINCRCLRDCGEVHPGSGLAEALTALEPRDE